MSILPQRRDWKFLGVGGGGGGSQRPKNLSKYMKLDWNFQRGVDNFWNQIILILANISELK